VRRLLSSVVVLGGVLATAHQAAAQPAQTYAYVDRVIVKEDNRVWIGVKGNLLQAVHGCPHFEFAVSPYPLSDDRARGWLQVALASYLSRTKVYIETRGCSLAADNLTAEPGYPWLVSLQVFRDD